MGIKRGNTTSTLFNKIDEIITLMVNEINGDEELVRLMTFISKNPLADRSVDYNNVKVYQYDVPKKLNVPIIKYSVVKNSTTLATDYRTSEQILFPYSYNDKKVTGNYPIMFVHNYSYDCNNIIGSNVYCIDLLIPSQYEEIQTVEGSNLVENRLHKIMGRIAYLFDKVSLDDVSREYLGDIEFKIVGKPTEEKINKTNDITITTVAIETKLINCRSDSNKRIRGI